MTPSSPPTPLMQRLLPGCMAFYMSALVSAVVTIVNTGVGDGVLLRALSAWSLALPVAIIAAYLTRPLAMATARVLSGVFVRDAG